jgi:hypothetical protein
MRMTGTAAAILGLAGSLILAAAAAPATAAF